VLDPDRGRAHRVRPWLDPDRADYASFADFTDPDGNQWVLQERGFRNQRGSASA
jgi:hypothetical protein